MKLSEIFETVSSSSYTSVASIGQVFYSAFPGYIKLYKRDDTNVPKNIACIRRNKCDGWRMNVTKDWQKMKLPHFGQLSNIKLPIKGKKTISNGLEIMMSKWGIKHDGLQSLE